MKKVKGQPQGWMSLYIYFVQLLVNVYMYPPQRVVGKKANFKIHMYFENSEKLNCNYFYQDFWSSGTKTQRYISTLITWRCLANNYSVSFITRDP